jgi:hypothetical protein
MNLNDIITEAEKVRLDPKCWTGKKIGDPKTKVKGGVRVNNCVPAESVAEGGAGSGRVDPLAWDTTSGKVGRVEKTATGIRHHADPSRYGGTEPSTEINKLDKTTTSATDKALGVKWDRESKRYYSPIKVDEQGYNPEYDDEAGMADNNLETLARAVEGIDDVISAGDNLPEWCQEKIAVAKSMLVAVWDYMKSEENIEQGLAEGPGFDKWADDRVASQLHKLKPGMVQDRKTGKWYDPNKEFEKKMNSPEVMAQMKRMAQKEDVSEGICSIQEANAIFDDFERSVEARGLTEDIFDTITDEQIIAETAAWRRKEGKSAKGGLNAKGVASYRRENPGSKLQTAVTTKPSKLKPGSKAAKRRKSFCARMGGVKGPMKKPNGKPTRKALALRKWNC